MNEKAFDGKKEVLTFDDNSLPKIFGAMGIAEKAGALSVGSSLSEQAIRSGKARFAFLADGISENTNEKIMRLISSKNIPYLNLPVDMKTMAEKLGKSNLTAVAVITKPGFDDIVYKLLGNKSEIRNNNTEVQ